MKSIKILVMILFVMTTVGFLNCDLALAEGKMAYIDLGKVFDDYKKAKDFEQVLEKEKQDKQGQRDKIVQDIRKLKDEVELLSKEAKEKKQTEIDQKLKDLQSFDQEVSMELRQKYDSMVKEILKEINTTIEEYGAKEKFDAIFDQRAILYSNESMNITEQILKILNSRYQENNQ